jgi:monoterpene epsilon-lactone hydrolase
MHHITARDQVRTILIRDIAPRFAGTDLETQRAMLDGMGAQAELPSGLLVERTTIAGVPVERLASTRREQRVVLYVHGGAFVMGSCDSHRSLCARLSAACKAEVILPEYRLAPEHPFPAGLEDLVDVYAGLLDSGLRPEQIVVAGDSAGGGLAISTLLSAAERGLPMPRALVLLSPFTDLTLTAPSLETHAAVDPWLRPQDVPAVRDTYLNGADPAHPLASPLWADLSKLPPTLIHVGDQEILLDDSTRLAERAAAAGVNVELEVGKELWHVWHFFAPALPEATEAIARIGDFVDQLFAPSISLRSCG